MKTDWSKEALELHKDRDLADSTAILQGNVVQLGYLPAQFYAIPQMAFESLSENDVPSQIKRPSYERKERFWRIVAFYAAFLMGELCTGLVILVFVWLKATGRV